MTMTANINTDTDGTFLSVDWTPHGPDTDTDPTITINATVTDPAATIDRLDNAYHHLRAYLTSLTTSGVTYEGPDT